MATTLHRIELLAAGVNTTAGVAVASGIARFYQPGTLVTEVVYSDSAGASPITQPVTLNAAGQATVYMLEPVRMIVKDSTETTTYFDFPILDRHDAVYITHPSFNGGAETTLEAVLTTAAASLGTSFQYKESTNATAYAWVTAMGELVVSTSAFGAVGDGTTDDTAAIQATIDRVKARGGGWVYIPKGTYKVTTGATSCLSIDTVGVNIMGAGRGVSIIKNFGTTQNAIIVNVGSAIDSKITIKDLSITHTTSSSLAGITVTNGNRIRFQSVAIALHRTGISASAVTGARFNDCVIESTDDNAAALGILTGARGRCTDCEVISGTVNGTGITGGADARITDCYVTKFVTGVLLSGARASAVGCHCDTQTTAYTASGGGNVITGCYASTVTTGFSLTGVRSRVLNCEAFTCTTGVSLGAATTCVQSTVLSTCTTGVSVGAHATCLVTNNIGTSNTADLTVNASATSAIITGNSWVSLPMYGAIQTTTSGVGGQTFTPDITAGQFAHWFIDSNTNVDTLTVAATATAGLSVAGGEMMLIGIMKYGGNAVSVTWNAQYVNPDGTAITASTGLGSIAGGRQQSGLFRWTGTAWALIGTSTAATA